MLPPICNHPACRNMLVKIVAHGGTLRLLTAYLRGVPVERMSWEPVANGSVVRLSPRQLRGFTRKEQQ